MTNTASWSANAASGWIERPLLQRHLHEFGEFFAKSALDPSTVKGMDGLMTEAVNLKFMTRVLTPTELAEFVQVPLK